MSDEIEQTIRKFALQNAVFFKGTANPKAVVGKILGSCPELRPKAGEITPLINQIVEDVNKMGFDAQKKALEEIDSSLLVKEKKERKYELPDLENVNGKVVMRIAPGPSGPLHIGHTRVSILNDEYVKRYGGDLVLRFEDTNPEKIDPDAYDMIPEDLDWLGVKCNKQYIQSDRFEMYYDYTRKLLEAGHAYVCTCNGDDWRRMKENKQKCPCHDLPAEIQLDRYDKFLAGDYQDGEAVVVVKTDICHPNPAVRDFVALRLVRTPHPRTGEKYIAYPMMNLSVAIDDHEMGMTHVIRGKDHLNNTFRQEYIFNYFGWKKPEYYHYGLVNIPDTVLKTSIIKQSIWDGEYTGWDDVRTGTVRAMKRRGIRPEAIRRYWVESGIKPVDIEFSWQNLFGMNRDIIDTDANRYFYVQDPVSFDIDGIDVIEGAAPKHPDHPERGDRKYRIEAPRTVSLADADYKMLVVDGQIRLKDLCNIKFGNPVEYNGNDVSILKTGVRAVQWVSGDALDATLVMPDGNVLKGKVEPAIAAESNDMVQLERIGFARIEKKDGKTVSMIFAHR